MSISKRVVLVAGASIPTAAHARVLPTGVGKRETGQAQVRACDYAKGIGASISA